MTYSLEGNSSFFFIYIFCIVSIIIGFESFDSFFFFLHFESFKIYIFELLQYLNQFSIFQQLYHELYILLKVTYFPLIFLYCVVIYIQFVSIISRQCESFDSLIFFGLSKILIFENNWQIFYKLLHGQVMTSLSNRNKK